MVDSFIFPIIGMVGALILTIIGYGFIAYLFGARVRLRPFKIEYTEPIESYRKRYIKRIEKRMKKHPPTEPYAIHVHKQIMKKAKLMLIMLAISYVFFNIFMLVNWYFLWSSG